MSLMIVPVELNSRTRVNKVWGNWGRFTVNIPAVRKRFLTEPRWCRVFGWVGELKIFARGDPEISASSGRTVFEVSQWRISGGPYQQGPREPWPPVAVERHTGGPLCSGNSNFYL